MYILTWGQDVQWFDTVVSIKELLRFDYTSYGDKKHLRITYDKLKELMIADRYWNASFSDWLNNRLEALFATQVYQVNSVRLTKKAGSFEHGVGYCVRRKNPALPWEYKVKEPVYLHSFQLNGSELVVAGLEIRAMTCDYDEQVVHLFAHSANRDVNRKTVQEYIKFCDNERANQHGTMETCR